MHRFPCQIFICNLTCYISHWLISWNFTDKREAGPKWCPCWADRATTSCQNLVRPTEELLLELRAATLSLWVEHLAKKSHLDQTVELTEEATSLFGRKLEFDDWDSRKVLATVGFVVLRETRRRHLHRNFSLKSRRLHPASKGIQINFHPFQENTKTFLKRTYICAYVTI